MALHLLPNESTRHPISTHVTPSTSYARHDPGMDLQRPPIEVPKSVSLGNAASLETATGQRVPCNPADRQPQVADQLGLSYGQDRPDMVSRWAVLYPLGNTGSPRPPDLPVRSKPSGHQSLPIQSASYRSHTSSSRSSCNIRSRTNWASRCFCTFPVPVIGHSDDWTKK